MVGFTDTTALMRTYGHERLYRLASGLAHGGKEWAMAALELTPSAGPPLAPGVRHGIFAMSEPVAIAMTGVAVEEVRIAVDELVAYRTAPRARRR